MLKLTNHKAIDIKLDPAAFRRLCVETYVLGLQEYKYITSRLQAAVC